MRLYFFLLLSLTFVLNSCDKYGGKQHGVFRNRIGNTYKNVNGTDDVYVHFKENKLEIFTNGTRTYKAGYLSSRSDKFDKIFYTIDSLDYLRFDYTVKGEEELTIYFSSTDIHGTIPDNEDCIRFGYGYSSIDAIILKKI